MITLQIKQIRFVKELKTTQTLKPNAAILETIQDHTYKVKKGNITILHTNLQVIGPTELNI